MTEEIWKAIPEYEGYYEISNSCRVRSLDRAVVGSYGCVYILKGREKKYSPDNKGYYTTTLSKNGKNKRFPIHRLIAITFIPNPDNKCCVNHIDGNKLNNSIENLEWATVEENAQHAYDTHLINHTTLKERGLKAAELKKLRTEQYTRDGELVGVFESQKEASEKTGISSGLISLCCNGKNKTAGGYVFKSAA